MRNYVDDDGPNVHQYINTYRTRARLDRFYGTHANQDMFRAKLNFEFSPTFDVTLGYGYTHTDDHGLTVNFSPFENTVGSFGGKLPTSFPGSFSVPTKLGEAAPSLDPGVEVLVRHRLGSPVVELGGGRRGRGIGWHSRVEPPQVVRGESGADDHCPGVPQRGQRPAKFEQGPRFEGRQ